jgi:hypothetical protein
MASDGCRGSVAGVPCFAWHGVGQEQDVIYELTDLSVELSKVDLVSETVRLLIAFLRDGIGIT